MNLRQFGLAVATIAALAPAMSNASAEQSAMKACARAFATSLASRGSAAPTFKVSYQGNLFAGSVLEFYSREYTFEMHANDQKTGLPIARASCSADRQGTVIALSSIPLDAVSPALAAELGGPDIG